MNSRENGDRVRSSAIRSITVLIDLRAWSEYRPNCLNTRAVRVWFVTAVTEDPYVTDAGGENM